MGIYSLVDPLEAPDYYNIIREPMDFSKIKYKLEVSNASSFIQVHEN